MNLLLIRFLVDGVPALIERVFVETDQAVWCVCVCVCVCVCMYVCMYVQNHKMNCQKAGP